jgi:hypothetical protein
MERGGVGALAPVKNAVLEGRALLWIAWDPGSQSRTGLRTESGTNHRSNSGAGGAAIVAAAVTELPCTEKRKYCVIVACGGRGLARWLALIAPLEDYARAEGCDAIRIIGREGWARVLHGFRRTAAVMDKEL